MRHSEPGRVEQWTRESLLFFARGTVVVVMVAMGTGHDHWWIEYPFGLFFFGMVGSTFIGAVTRAWRAWRDL